MIEQNTILTARLADAIRKAEKGQTAVLPFLSPLEIKQSERWLKECGKEEFAWYFGGYENAERKTLFLLPEYLLEYIDTEKSTQSYLDVLGDDAHNSVVSVYVTGSKFRDLKHRDYLGSILNLGLKREALGDIVIQNKYTAVVFCSSVIATFLCENLQKIANDAVHCKIMDLKEDFIDGKQYKSIVDTVASQRLDCVVSALTNLSREKAQELIEKGLVDVDYEQREQKDFELKPPAVISVRGYGRFILQKFDGETKKGRLRMKADQVIG